MTKIRGVSNTPHPFREFTVSVDDGYTLDIKVAELLKKYGINATFYIPSICKLQPEQIRQLAQEFEIGGHTVSHVPDMKLLSDSQAFDEIWNNKQMLEGIIGREISKFCYPRGRYNESTIKAVKKAGFKSARTTLVFHTQFPENHYRTHPTIHAHPKRKEYTGELWTDLADECLREVLINGGRFEMFCHSWEIENLKLWDQFEYVLKGMSYAIKSTTYN